MSTATTDASKPRRRHLSTFESTKDKLVRRATDEEEADADVGLLVPSLKLSSFLSSSAPFVGRLSFRRESSWARSPPRNNLA